MARCLVGGTKRDVLVGHTCDRRVAYLDVCAHGASRSKHFVCFWPRCVKREFDIDLATLDLSERSLRRFLEVGKGKETPENTATARFYTTWADRGISRLSLD